MPTFKIGQELDFPARVEVGADIGNFAKPPPLKGHFLDDQFFKNFCTINRFLHDSLHIPAAVGPESVPNSVFSQDLIFKSILDSLSQRICHNRPRTGPLIRTRPGTPKTPLRCKNHENPIFVENPARFKNCPLQCDLRKSYRPNRPLGRPERACNIGDW